MTVWRRSEAHSRRASALCGDDEVLERPKLLEPLLVVTRERLRLSQTVTVDHRPSRWLRCLALALTDHA